jgi:hypothetical protein
MKHIKNYIKLIGLLVCFCFIQNQYCSDDVGWDSAPIVQKLYFTDNDAKMDQQIKGPSDQYYYLGAASDAGGHRLYVSIKVLESIKDPNDIKFKNIEELDPFRVMRNYYRKQHQQLYPNEWFTTRVWEKMENYFVWTVLEKFNKLVKQFGVLPRDWQARLELEQELL